MESLKQLLCSILLFLFALVAPAASALELVGVSVTPHVQSPNLRYRRPPDPQLGARVELFLQNETSAPLTLRPDFRARFDGATATELLANGDWAWHDTPSARSNTTITLSPGALTVWSFNSRGTNWGAGTGHQLQVGAAAHTIPLPLDRPQAWLSAVTFLGEGASVIPTRVVAHVVNETGSSLTLRACRLWLPESQSDFRAFRPGEWQTNLACFPARGTIAPGARGGFTLDTGPLPLTYGVVEVRAAGPDGRSRSLWAHLRIKREVFDLGGGWVAAKLGTSNTLTAEPYLKTLRRMHINAGMHDTVSGYTDNDALYAKYPLKYMNRCQPFVQYDTDAVLPRIHAVEFLGEPEFGGGRPVPPQKVFEAFEPYGTTRLPTSVTHSEERIWRYYAGLSDYPHYDAYRVTAPAPDQWPAYDRWGGEKISWGAPLETIGDMTRSLRELNRPRPIAYWSQGPNNWDRYGGRQRTSPTPDELRAQAFQALAQRITSLYWFNLSLKSLVKFRDLIAPITRVNREIRLMEDLLLEGDAFAYRRELRVGQPNWDLATVAGPNGALCFALDLAYVPDAQEKVFKFTPRDGVFRFQLPAWLDGPVHVFRLDADGTHDVRFTVAPGRLEIRDRVQVVAVYVATADPAQRARLQARQAELRRCEREHHFDPAGEDSDFETLRKLLP